MKIAYLASRLTLPGPQARKVEVAEHQQMMSALQPAFSEAALQLVELRWDEPGVDWRQFDAAVIGTAWDYCDRHTEFLQTLDTIASQTLLFNTPDIVRWNSQKTYLRELQRRGVPVVPTVWIDDPSKEVNWANCFSELKADSLVVKRQVGANSEGQFLLAKADPAPALEHPMMVQPFLQSIVDEGEYSLIFIDGEFSHALIKRPRSGDYRIQASYGGMEEAVTLDDAQINTARSVLDALDELPLYARVDMIRGVEGTLELMELELVEPFLYPLQSTRLGELFSTALLRRLN